MIRHILVLYLIKRGYYIFFFIQVRQKKRHCTGSIGEGRAIATTEGGSLKRKSILEFRLRLRKGNHRSRCLASPRSSASYSLGLQSKAASPLWKSPAQINCQQKLNQTASQTYGVRPTSWSWLPAPVLWKKKVRRNSDEKKPEKLKKKGTAKKDRRRSCQQKRSRCFFQRKSPSFETRFVYHVASPLLPLEHTNLRMAPNASRLGQAFLKKQQQPTKSIKNECRGLFKTSGFVQHQKFVFSHTLNAGGWPGQCVQHENGLVGLYGSVWRWNGCADERPSNREKLLCSPHFLTTEVRFHLLLNLVVFKLQPIHQLSSTSRTCVSIMVENANDREAAEGGRNIFLHFSSGFGRAVGKLCLCNSAEKGWQRHANPGTRNTFCGWRNRPQFVTRPPRSQKLNNNYIKTPPKSFI